MASTAKALSLILFVSTLESIAAAQAAPPPAPAAPPVATAPPAPAPVSPQPPAAPPGQLQPYYAPPPVYPRYPQYAPYPPPQGYWIPIPPEPPKERAYQPGTPVPRGYHVEERHPRWAIITGVAMLGSAYLTGILTSTDGVCTYNTNCHTRWAMAVPIVGPFVDMSQDGRSDRVTTDVLIGSGQVAGAIFLIIGLATTTPRLIPDFPRASIGVSPMLASSTAGLTMTLRE